MKENTNDLVTFILSLTSEEIDKLVNHMDEIEAALESLKETPEANKE